MKKLRTGGLIAIICVVGMGIVLGARSVRSDAAHLNVDTARAGGTATTVASATPDAVTPQTAAVPDKVVYGLFFRQIAAFNAKAEETEKNGGDGRSLRKHFARIAGLNDTESELLDRVVADYLREAGLIETRQKAVVDAYRVKYPDGHVPEGETRERPPSFHEFALEREQLYLRMHDQLQRILGPESFARLDTAIRSKVTGNPQSMLGATAPSATEEEKQ